MFEVFFLSYLSIIIFCVPFFDEDPHRVCALHHKLVKWKKQFQSQCRKRITQGRGDTVNDIQLLAFSGCFHLSIRKH